MPDLSITINDLNTRITFQEPTITKDAGGAQQETYANVASNPTVWSNWVYAYGAEIVQSEALKSIQRATVTIRHRSDVRETWQILNDGNKWKILSIDQVRERNRWTVLIVERTKATV